MDGVVELDEPRWVQSIVRTLRGFVLAGSRGDVLRFSVVLPDDLSARTLQASIMSDEEVVMNGRAVVARRVRISLPGTGVLIWRSTYWYRLSDGLLVHLRFTGDPAGTPMTLAGDSGSAPAMVK